MAAPRGAGVTLHLWSEQGPSVCQDKLERVSAVKICVSERVSVGAHVSEIKGVYEYSSGCGGKSPSGLGCYQRSEGPVTSERSTENILCGLGAE